MKILMKNTRRVLPLLLFILIITAGTVFSKEFTPQDLLKLQYVSSTVISPDGSFAAYTVRVPRKADEKPGGAYSELYLVSLKDGKTKPFITGKVNVYSVQWRPDGQALAFTMKRGKEAKYQVWEIDVNGGEAKQLTDSPTGVSSFHYNPVKNELAYIAYPERSAREKALAKKGYNFIFYEENIRNRSVYLLDLQDPNAEPQQLTSEMNVWSFIYSPNGKYIAAGMSEKNLIDQRYMFQHIYLIETATGKMTRFSNNPGKLGNYAFSPDSRHIAYTASLSRQDHAVSQVFVKPLAGGEAVNLTPTDFRGHVNYVLWKNNRTIIYKANEGVNTTLSTVSVNGGKRKIILNSANTGIVFGIPSFDGRGKTAVVTGSSPALPGELFLVKKGKMRQLTDLNPLLHEATLGKQEVIRYTSRDGAAIEGLLIYPVNFQKGTKYPLIVIVHGGPESNYSNGWLTRYSTPGQVLANRGYAVFYPNYRASTGYGVKYAAVGYEDPAGKEFDDIADGIEYLIGLGLVDKNRVGLGGGSYGGYASAWFATYYTDYVKAVCMFVGISDLISKRGTTDIPYEELYVHSGKKLEETWDLSLKRSPIYWAHQSKTATLIYGGAADTRVHPSQSMELYRRMKMNNHPAVRLVQYPGEGHGNRKQPGRIDVLYRQLDWYDWYVKEAKPLNGPMPPLDISDKYGLNLPE